MNSSWTEIVGVFVSVLGFCLVYWQLQQNKKAIEAQTNAMIYQLSQNIYDILISNPSLRPYFYENKPMPNQEPARSEVLATAELLCDFFEYIILEQTVLSTSIREGWIRYMKIMYRDNSVLRDYLQIRGEQYSSQLIDVLTSSYSVKKSITRRF